MRTVVAEIDGARGEEHEGSVVSFFWVHFVVVGGGEVDAGAPLQRCEEGRCHVGPKPAGHPVQLLVR